LFSWYVLYRKLVHVELMQKATVACGSCWLMESFSFWHFCSDFHPLGHWVCLLQDSCHYFDKALSRSVSSTCFYIEKYSTSWELLSSHTALFYTILCSARVSPWGLPFAAKATFHHREEMS
jgi:hypothetical protein